MVIGYPLTHSQSPLLHNMIYQQLDINAIFVAKPHVKLSALIDAIKTFSIGLTAVTLPYKEKVLKFLDHCSPEVRAIGAANTIIQKKDKLFGYNTDVDGIAFAFRHVSIKNKQTLIIGAGGAARALAYFLKKNHAKIFWLNRTQHKAKILAKKFGGTVIKHEALGSINIDIIINTTPSYSPLPNYIFNAKQIVFDMVYNPMMTCLLKAAKKKKATIISGLDMFIGQGLKQIALLIDQRIHVSTNKLRKILIKDQQERCV